MKQKGEKPSKKKKKKKEERERGNKKKIVQYRENRGKKCGPRQLSLAETRRQLSRGVLKNRGGG